MYFYCKIGYDISHMDATPHKFGHSIVLLGNFNPKIFHPAWFAAEGLISNSECEDAKVDIIHTDAAIFKLEWLRVEVLHERFRVDTYQEPYIAAVRDLVLGTFSILRHTPVHSIGMNVDKHFRMDSEEKWHEAGHRLAPKGIWEGIMTNPGLQSMSMQDTVRPDGCDGSVNVLIQPSREIKPGILFQVNDHYDIGTEGVRNADAAVDILRSNWQQSIDRANAMIGKLLERMTK